MTADEVAAALLAIAEAQLTVTDSLAKALQSLALQADRYDSELAAIRSDLAECQGAAHAATAAVRAAGLLHSVKA